VETVGATGLVGIAVVVGAVYAVVVAVSVVVAIVVVVPVDVVVGEAVVVLLSSTGPSSSWPRSSLAGYLLQRRLLSCRTATPRRSRRPKQPP
jgi:hypothetical protein